MPEENKLVALEGKELEKLKKKMAGLGAQTVEDGTESIGDKRAFLAIGQRQSTTYEIQVQDHKAGCLINSATGQVVGVHGDRVPFVVIARFPSWVVQDDFNNPNKVYDERSYDPKSAIALRASSSDFKSRNEEYKENDRSYTRAWRPELNFLCTMNDEALIQVVFAKSAFRAGRAFNGALTQFVRQTGLQFFNMECKMYTQAEEARGNKWHSLDATVAMTPDDLITDMDRMKKFVELQKEALEMIQGFKDREAEEAS